MIHMQEWFLTKWLTSPSEPCGPFEFRYCTETVATVFQRRSTPINSVSRYICGLSSDVDLSSCWSRRWDVNIVIFESDWPRVVEILSMPTSRLLWMFWDVLACVIVEFGPETLPVVIAGRRSVPAHSSFIPLWYLWLDFLFSETLGNSVRGWQTLGDNLEPVDGLTPDFCGNCFWATRYVIGIVRINRSAGWEMFLGSNNSPLL